MTGPGQDRDRFTDLVRREHVPLGDCCALIAARLAGAAGLPSRPDEVTACRVDLDLLAAQVTGSGPADERLRSVLAGFHGMPDAYDDLRASLLPQVLRRRRGLPILLSVVWLEVAARVGVPAYGIGLPGHFVVGLGDPDGYHLVVDPFHGGRTVGRAELRRLVGAVGAGGGTLDTGALRPWEPVETLQRVLRNVVVWAQRRQQGKVQREALELALLLPRHSLDLRREHAELMLRLGGFAEGAAELEDYADVVERVDAAAAEQARTEARRARARLN